MRLLDKRHKRKRPRKQDNNTKSEEYMANWDHWLLGTKSKTNTRKQTLVKIVAKVMIA